MRIDLREVFDLPLKLTQEIGSLRKVFATNYPNFTWFQIFTCNLGGNEYLVYNAKEDGFYRVDFELIDLKKGTGLQKVKDVPVRLFSTIISLYDIHIKNHHPIKIYAHDSKYYHLYKKILMQRIDTNKWNIEFDGLTIKCKPIGKIHRSTKMYKEIMEAIR